MEVKKSIGVLLYGLLLFSCSSKPDTATIEVWKAEIMAVEKAFNDKAQKDGIVEAFEFYAADDGVIKRGKRVIEGKNAIAEWYRNDIKGNEKLTWQPTFVDVSKSGDMAYTYGDFVFRYPDSLGVKKESKGIFHTIWKRQQNGEWKFVWD